MSLRIKRLEKFKGIVLDVLLINKKSCELKPHVKNYKTHMNCGYFPVRAVISGVCGYIPLTHCLYLSLHRCWRTPQGSAGWWSPPSLQSATPPPTLQPCPPHTTCPPTWLTHTSSPTLTLSTPLSAQESCPRTSTTSTTFPQCTAIQVRTC